MPNPYFPNVDEEKRKAFDAIDEGAELIKNKVIREGSKIVTKKVVEKGTDPIETRYNAYDDFLDELYNGESKINFDGSNAQPNNPTPNNNKTGNTGTNNDSNTGSGNSGDIGNSGGSGNSGDNSNGNNNTGNETDGNGDNRITRNKFIQNLKNIMKSNQILTKNIYSLKIYKFVA